MTDLPIDANFKSTLPPRKRAKTKEEKEQRRVERILRNRRAAHASREKKRKHVEYLEAYVLKLEQNLQDSQANYNEVAKVLTDAQRQGVTLRPLADLSDLKTKIHSNLNSSVSPKKKDEEDDEDEEDSIEESVSVKEEETPDTVEAGVKIEDEDNFLSVSKKRKLSETAPKDSYYNYLSPISINSPINSPIDLTLGKPGSYDLLGQNSEVILRSAYKEKCPWVCLCLSHPSLSFSTVCVR